MPTLCEPYEFKTSFNAFITSSFDTSYNILYMCLHTFSLFNRTIPQQLLYTMDCLCFNCMKPLDKTFNKMPCGCKLCNSCLINFIMEGTDHHIILNEYEKHTSKLKKVKCCCGNPFDLEAGIESLYKEAINAMRSYGGHSND